MNLKLNITLKFLAVISLIVLLTYSYYKIPKLTYGFAAYYTFSKILLDGESLSKGYEAEFFNQKINEYGFKNIYDLYNIIPTNAFVYLPVVLLAPGPAKITWGIFSLIFLISSLILLLKTFDIKYSDNMGLLFIIMVFLWHPLYENLALGQMYIFLLFLFSLSLYGLRKNVSILNWLPVTLSVLFKGYGVLYYAWLYFTKHFKRLIISSTVMFALILITLPIIHLATWETFFDVTFSTLGRFNEDSNVAYQTINGFVRHMLVYDKELNPNALANISSNIVFFFVILINLTVVILILFKTKNYYHDKEFNLISLSAIIASIVTTAPMAEEYTYALFLPLTIALGYTLFRKNSDSKEMLFTIPKILYIFAVLELMLPIHYKTLQLSSFPVFLMAYPKLYGGLILLGIFYSLKSVKPSEVQ